MPKKSKHGAARRAKVAAATADVPRVSYSVAEFCVAHRISESFFYKLRGLGLGPRETRVLGKVTITLEDAGAWRREQAANNDVADEIPA